MSVSERVCECGTLLATVFDFGEGGDGIRIQVDDIGMQLKVKVFWPFFLYFEMSSRIFVLVRPLVRSSVHLSISNAFIKPR